MTSMTDETIIKKNYRDSAELLLSHTLAKITRPVTLEEVRSRISSHMTYSGDSTTLIRRSRNRKYGGIQGHHGYYGSGTGTGPSTRALK